MQRRFTPLITGVVASLAMGMGATADLTIDRDALGPSMLTLDFAHITFPRDIQPPVNVGINVGELIQAEGFPFGPGGPYLWGGSIYHIGDGGIWDPGVKNGFVTWGSHGPYDPVPRVRFWFREGPVASVGGFFTSHAIVGELDLRVYDHAGSLLEAYDIVAVAPCPNNGLDNNSEFRGIVRAQPDITYFDVLASYAAMDDMTYAHEPPISCEFDGNPAQVDVNDLLTYLTFWFALDPAADLDSSGAVEVFDLLTYLDCWFSSSG